jgi:arsenate reductase
LPGVDDVDNEELERLLSEGIPFVDVRSVDEFNEGHIPGALNVPVLLSRPGEEPVPNPDFVRVVESVAPAPGPLALGCASGIRSRHARALLAQAGYTQTFHLAGGLLGGRDAFGAKIRGWQESGKTVTQETVPGTTYNELKRAFVVRSE